LFVTTAETRMKEFVGGSLDFGISETRIAQSVPERKERIVRDVEVVAREPVRGVEGPSRGRGRVADRDLTDASKKGHRKLAGGIVVAEEDVGDRVPGLRARGPAERPPIRQFRLHPRAEGNALAPVDERGPVSFEVSLVVGERAHEGDPLIAEERKQASLVPEEDQRLPGGLAREPPVVVDGHGERRVPEGLAEETLVVLKLEDPPDGGVDLPLGQRTSGEETLRMFPEEAAVHLEIDPGPEGLEGRGGPVVNELRDRLPIGDDEAAKVPRLSKDVGEESAVRRRGDAVQIVKGRHHLRRPGRDGRPVRREIGLVEFTRADVGGIVLTARLRGPVGREVLDRSEERPRSAERWPLK
jgi:hypothetical protein